MATKLDIRDLDAPKFAKLISRNDSVTSYAITDNHGRFVMHATMQRGDCAVTTRNPHGNQVIRLNDYLGGDWDETVRNQLHDLELRYCAIYLA